MTKKKKFQGDDKGSLYVDFLPQEVFEGLDEEMRDNLITFQRYSINRRRQELGIEKLEKKLKPLLKDLKERKSKLKSHKKNEKKYFDRVSHLKLKFEPIISIYEKDESSKSYKSDKYFNYKKKTYKGKPLKKRVVLYSQIKSHYNPDFGYIQKNIYLGSKEKIRKICGEILNEDLTDVKKNTLFLKIRKVLIPYIRHHSKEGFEEFVMGDHPFHGRIVKWCKDNSEEYS